MSEINKLIRWAPLDQMSRIVNVGDVFKTSFLIIYIKKSKKWMKIARLTATADTHALKKGATNRSCPIIERLTGANMPGFMLEEKKEDLSLKMTVPCTTFHRLVHHHRPVHHFRPINKYKFYRLVHHHRLVHHRHRPVHQKIHRLWAIAHLLKKMKKWHLPRFKELSMTKTMQILSFSEDQWGLRNSKNKQRNSLKRTND